MNITVPSDVIDQLNKFIVGNSIANVERTPYLNLNIIDKENDVTLSLVFIRDLGTMEPDDLSTIEIKGKGGVFIIPGFWLGVNHTLAINYITYIIKEFYREKVSDWKSSL